MAETPLKRQREETQVEDFEETKRHKSYNHILSILEEEEEDPTQDISSLITTLQQELSSSPATATTDQESSTPANTAAIDDYPSSSSSSSSGFLKEEEEDDKERVMRHLLEASDDELGIPDREVVNGDGFEEFVSNGNGFNESEGFSLCDSLWEFEDANANYYTLLQSDLFM